MTDLRCMCGDSECVSCGTAQGTRTPEPEPLTDAEELQCERAIRFRIRMAASYPKLLDAAMRFVSSMHGRKSGEYAQREAEYHVAPEKLLTVHSHVMNARSARCKTLRALADVVIRESGLAPYMRNPGMYRGQNYVVNYSLLPESWKRP